MAEHKTHLVRDPWTGERIPIDQEISVAIASMWRLGIRTLFSCQQDSTGKVWIMFDSSEDANSFLSVLCPDPDRDIELNRVLRGDPMEKESLRWGWRSCARIVDNEWDCRPGVLIPRDHFNMVHCLLIDAVFDREVPSSQ